MITKGLLAILCCFALVSSAIPQVVATTNTHHYDAQQQQYGSSYDAVQNQRMSAIEDNVSSLQKSSETQQKAIEELIKAQSQWAGGLQTLIGLIGFTSVVGLGIQVYEKVMKKDKA
jgi:uncharacterized protein YlxW (UPF0749 family)